MSVLASKFDLTFLPPLVPPGYDIEPDTSAFRL